MIGSKGPGQKHELAPYTLDAVIGSGGFWTVYRALYPRGGYVALKVLTPHGGSEETVLRFEREGNIRSDHPNVVQVLDSGRDQGLFYIALELLVGKPLISLLEHAPLEPDAVIDLGLQVCGYPNLFTLVGPHNASTFCNMTRCIEQNADWVTALIRHMLERGYSRAEPSGDAEAGWTAHVHESASRMLFTQIDSWMTGINSNVPTKRGRKVVVYAAGAPKYREKCEAVAANGYEGFLLR